MCSVFNSSEIMNNIINMNVITMNEIKQWRECNESKVSAAPKVGNYFFSGFFVKQTISIESQ